MEFDFEKNGTVADINAIPEKYRGLYEEGKGNDGNPVFNLADAAKGLVGDYIGTTRALSGARNDKKKASDESATRRQSLKLFDDLAESLGVEVGEAGVAEALKIFVAELQNKVKGGKDLQINLDKINTDWKKRVDELTATKDKEIGERDSALSDYLISKTAVSALSAAKAKSVELLLPHVEKHCKVVRDEQGKYSVRVLDSQGDFRTNASGGWMGVEELVGEMKSNSNYAPAFESEVPGGTGSRPGSMRTVQNQPNRELSPTEKIRLGLQKKQYKSGVPGKA